ncbi:hypothetical protein [Candidatus Poriferisodalis sp.]|uniref:hypothetical protein n=1 Tax=Candidatus Poriferisodalis sp. TaxID=3101277 RepID=UPI003B01349D
MGGRTGRVRSAAKLVVDLGGGAAILEAVQAEMQRILRDICTVQAHLMVSAVVYGQYGQILLGMTEGGALL